MSTAPKDHRTTHTPGPWRLVGREVLGMDFTGMYRLICKVSGGSPEHADGNAKLIAAALDMKDALEFIRDHSGDPVMENTANAALAKAEGK